MSDSYSHKASTCQVYNNISISQCYLRIREKSCSLSEEDTQEDKVEEFS